MDISQGKMQSQTPIWSRPWILVLLILLVYANSWGNPFILDDVTHIRDDPRLTDWQNWTEVFSSPFFQFKEAGLAQYYRPLVKLTYKIERFFFGINPFGYHLVNTILHCLNALLLYLICRLIIGRSGPAFIAALIFGIHPLQTEEVSYISGLGGLAAASGILASIYCFLRFRADRRTFFYILSNIFFVAGLLFKESAIILPVFLIWVMIVYRPKRSTGSPVSRMFRGGNAPDSGWRAGLYLIPYIICLGLYLLLRATVLVRTDFLSGLTTGFWLRFLTFGKGIWIYLGLFSFPLHLHFYRSLELISPGIYPLSLLLPAGIGIIFLWLVVRYRRISSPVLLGFGWFLIALLPFSGLHPIFLESGFLYWGEHFMYLPLAGLGMALAGIISGDILGQSRNKKVKIYAVVCGLLFFSFMGIMTIRQNKIWSDELIFFERMNRYEPELFRTAGLLGIAYLKRGRVEEALAADIRARQLLLARSGVEAEEDMPPMDRYMLKLLLWRISQSYRILKQYELALDTARELESLYPDGYRGKYLLGRAYFESGKYEKALPYLLSAYELKPDDYKVARALILCYRNRGEFEKSREIWSEAAGHIPEFKEAKKILQERREE